jgi:hypothetical protein
MQVSSICGVFDHDTFVEVYLAVPLATFNLLIDLAPKALVFRCKLALSVIVQQFKHRVIELLIRDPSSAPNVHLYVLYRELRRHRRVTIVPTDHLQVHKLVKPQIDLSRERLEVVRIQ